MMMPKAILFDWDGTLADTADLILTSHNHVRAMFGHPPWTHADIFAGASRSAREAYPEIYGPDAPKALEALYTYIKHRDLSKIAPFAGAEALLADLKGKGVPLGVVSHKRHEALHDEIIHFAWTGYFGAVVGAGEAARDKPSADPIFLALSRMGGGIAARDIWYVGDTETDLMAASAAMCPCIFIDHGTTPSGTIERYAPLMTLPSLAALHAEIREKRA